MGNGKMSRSPSFSVPDGGTMGLFDAHKTRFQTSCR